MYITTQLIARSYCSARLLSYCLTGKRRKELKYSTNIASLRKVICKKTIATIHLPRFDWQLTRLSAVRSMPGSSGSNQFVLLGNKLKFIISVGVDQKSESCKKWIFLDRY